MVFEDTKSTWVYRDADNHVISIPDGLAGAYANTNLDNMIVFEAELTNPKAVVSATVGSAKFICTGFNCSIYVFGSSAGGICPSCESEGMQVPPEQVESFLDIWESARSRSIHNS